MNKHPKLHIVGTSEKASGPIISTFEQRAAEEAAAKQAARDRMIAQMVFENIYSMNKGKVPFARRAGSALRKVFIGLTFVVMGMALFALAALL